MSRRSRFALALAVCGFAFAAAPSAIAQQPTSAGDQAQARELLNQGVDLRNHGDLSGAIEKLKAAHALARTPVTGLELGRTYSAAGQLVEARETFLSVARIGQRPEETSRSVTARRDSERFAEELRPRIPNLTVKITGITGAPADTVAVTIDGTAVPIEALAAPRLLDPGRHTVSARSTSGGKAETAVDLKEGETREVELKLELTSTPAPARAIAPSPVGPDRVQDSAAVSRSHALEWSLIVGGAVLAGAGITLMAVEAGSAQDAVNRVDRSAYDSAQTLWTVGLVGSIAGAAALATGGVLFAIHSPSENPIGGASPKAAGARTWIHVGVGRLELQGQW